MCLVAVQSTLSTAHTEGSSMNFNVAAAAYCIHFHKCVILRGPAGLHDNGHKMRSVDKWEEVGKLSSHAEQESGPDRPAPVSPCLLILSDFGLVFS